MAEAGPGLVRRLWWLPARERALVAVSLLLAPVPALGTLLFPDPLAWLVGHPVLMPVATALLLLAVLLVFEPPPTFSFRGYGRHLAHRFAVVQTHYTAALARHLPKEPAHEDSV